MMGPRALPLLMGLLLTACHSWRPTAISPQALIPVEQPSSVRVTLRSGARVTLENPTMRNDSIFGVTDAGVATLAGQGVASEDIGLLEVRRTSVLRSIGLGYLVLVGVLTAVAVVGCGVSPESCDL